MEQVNSTNQLGGDIAYFTGKTLADSMAAAKEFEKKHGVTMQRYYVQKFDGRSILADYK